MNTINIFLEDDVATVEAGKKIAQFLLEEAKERPQLKTVLLFGSLGAGKTTFTRGFVSAFNGAEKAEVSSPTFTLINQYPTSPLIFHADLYRLAEMCPENSFVELPEELEEAIESNKIYTLIEWAEYLAPNSLPIERLDIFLKVGNNARSLIIEGKLLEDDTFHQKLNNFLAS